VKQCVHTKYRTFRSHNIVELEATGLKQLPVNELIGCLGEWTLDNIKSLNVSGSGFVDVSGVGVHVIISLSKLRSLCTLNVSSTTFNSHALDIVTSDLPHLRSLDISETLVKDINPLLRCKHRLRYFINCCVLYVKVLNNRISISNTNIVLSCLSTDLQPCLWVGFQSTDCVYI